MNFRLYSLAIAAGVLALAVGALLRRGRKTPEEIERERRLRLTKAGRIVDGTLTDVHELQADGRGPIQLLVYRYDVAGVSYEASQDVTHLGVELDAHNYRVGQP